MVCEAFGEESFPFSRTVAKVLSHIQITTFGIDDSSTWNPVGKLVN